MQIHRMITAFDAADGAQESSFWAALLGGVVEQDDDWYSIVVDGEYRAAVQASDNFVPPVWPQGPQQQQVHVDLYVDDLAEAGREAVALGATFLGDGEGWVVYASPAGHPFCFCQQRD